MHISFEEALKAAGGDDQMEDGNGGKTTPITAAGWGVDDSAAAVTASKSGAYKPMELIIARPFIEHLMMSAVMTVAGRDTGATLFGPADMCATPTCKRRAMDLLAFGKAH